MRVLAFDPGYERLGVAVIEKIKGGKEVLVHSECVRTPATMPFPERLSQIGAAAEGFIKKWKPDAVALEELYFEKNAKTAMKVGAVSGVLTYIAAKNSLPLYEYTPLEVKVAVTGYGRSDKKAVDLMVRKILGEASLPSRRRVDDEMDAIAVGITCLASVR